MVTIFRKKDDSAYGVTLCEVYCKSTDEKPIEGMTNGSTLYEIDTAAVFMFDGDTDAWVEQ